MNLLLRAANAVERLAFRVLGAFVRGLTSFLVRVMRRGRFRSWRREA
jgi:hypothetical protein